MFLREPARRVARREPGMYPGSLSSHQSVFVLGTVVCCGQEYQKQPFTLVARNKTRIATARCPRRTPYWAPRAIGSSAGHVRGDGGGGGPMVEVRSAGCYPSPFAGPPRRNRAALPRRFCRLGPLPSRF